MGTSSRLYDGVLCNFSVSPSPNWTFRFGTTLGLGLGLGLRGLDLGLGPGNAFETKNVGNKTNSQTVKNCLELKREFYKNYPYFFVSFSFDRIIWKIMGRIW